MIIEIIALTGMTIGVILMTNEKHKWITKLVNQFKDEISFERREKHTKDLSEIYKRISDVGFTESKGKLVRTYPRNYEEFDLDNTFIIMEKIRNNDPLSSRIEEEHLDIKKDYEYFGFALEHLKHKKYRDIYKHWETANKLIEEYNNSPKFTEQLQQKIRDSTHERFPDFEEKKGISYYEHFFKIQTITDYIMDKIWYVKEHTPESLLKDLIVDRLTSGFDCICTRGAGGIDPHLGSIAKEKLDLEKYTIMLVAILTDKEICESLDKETTKKFEIIKEQEEFKKQLQFLIIKLKVGELIEGKCSIGF